jgi:peptidoglycan/LPS O-acetylase OafA/YrhL
MGNALKGMIAGFVATLILSGLMLLNSTMDLMPQINIVRMLANLATLSTTAAWMDHFIVGVVIWGLLFAVYDGVATRPAHWLKGIIVGVFAWLMMMVAFMPLAGAGFFGAKMGITALVGLLICISSMALFSEQPTGFLASGRRLKLRLICPRRRSL